MKTILVRYKTTEAHADANEANIHAVFAELRSLSPRGIRYASHRLPGGEFVHVAVHDGKSPLAGLAAFKKFQAELKDRCLEPPVVTELSAIDSYEWGPT